MDAGWMSFVILKQGGFFVIKHILPQCTEGYAIISTIKMTKKRYFYICIYESWGSTWDVAKPTNSCQQWEDQATKAVNGRRDMSNMLGCNEHVLMTLSLPNIAWDDDEDVYSYFSSQLELVSQTQTGVLSEVMHRIISSVLIIVVIRVFCWTLSLDS